jgi:hypothetical protein
MNAQKVSTYKSPPAIRQKLAPIMQLRVLFPYIDTNKRKKQKNKKTKTTNNSF